MHIAPQGRAIIRAWHDRGRGGAKIRRVRMTKGGQCKAAAIAVFALLGIAGEASAAQCGSSAAGFETWKRQFAEEARGRGVSPSAISALMGTHYASATIAADRGQHGFRLSLDQFLAKRGGSAI